MNWHTKGVDKVYEEVASSAKGLTTKMAEERLAKDGLNELQEGKQKSIWMIFFAQFKDIMILILLSAALISGLMGGLKDTIVILVIVLFNAAIGFYQEYRAEKAMLALKQLSVVKAKVIRDDKTSPLDAPNLVVGDIVVLETGDAIPADLRIIESVNLKIEEAALTGESNAVDKITDAIEKEHLSIGDRTNLAFKGTFVTHGRGSGVVIAIGMQTELGRIAKLLQEAEVLTPLQQRMASFGKKLSLIVLALCVVFFIAGWLRGEEVIKMLMTSISLAVAAIPEALPAVITISLALAAKRMIKLNALIRKLPAVETLGSVTYICTDKTGTLTKNKMLVEQVFINDQLIARKDIAATKDQKELAMLLQAFALNNDVKTDHEKLLGDSTEIALMEIAFEHKIDIAAWPRQKEIPFDATRKLMTTFHVHDNKIISFTKGAPDILLQKCVEINTDQLLKETDTMAADGLRVLGFAYRYWDKMPEKPDAAVHEAGLQFLGLTGMIDPPREEVAAAIEECKTAGIVPVMITGDHPLTAETIAKRIGIIATDKDLVITGEDLAKLGDPEFLAKVEQVKVYARVSPEQKLHIVKMLQEKGHFVAMTGDGVNDAPSLKRANIGIAMGITGTDVSKEAAHMILIDDNFSTIIKAVKEGRRIYDNILKFIKYLMTTNTGELMTLLIGPLLGMPIALLPIHILWINLVSDGLPAISLSFEKEEENIMQRPPRPPKETVFSNGRGFQMLWVGMLMAAIALAAQWYSIKNNLHWQTIVFNVLCLSQLANVLAIRSNSKPFFSKGLFDNKLLIYSVLFTALLQVAVTFIPFLQSIFKTESLTINEILAVAALSSIVFIVVEIQKYVLNKKKAPR